MREREREKERERGGRRGEIEIERGTVYVCNCV